jgi:thiol-disulfide isomerase/thioredoxin
MTKLLGYRFFYLASVTQMAIIISVAISNIVFASEPNLTGSMKKFNLAPTSQLQSKDIITWGNSDGKSDSLTHYKGKVVLINYWATWCLPCIQELPSIDRLQSKLSGKDFTVIAISLDRGGRTTAKRTFKRLEIKNLSLYTDKDSKSAKILGVRYMPTTFIFDRNGRELGKLEGKAEWDDKDAISLIKFFINKRGYEHRLQLTKK